MTPISDAELDALGLTSWERTVAPPQPKPVKRRAKPEDVFHIAVAKALRRTIGEAGTLGYGDVVWFSTELRNAGRTITTKQGRKINLEGIRRKSAGCVAGIPDVTVIHKGRYHGIELKAADGDLSKSQRELHPILRSAGCRLGTAWDIEQVFGLLRAWAVPHRGVTF